MIGIRDATTLALTKLRTRKVRLVVTIVISGLLFSGLAGASSVARGAFGSINAFNSEGLGDRFIVQAVPASSNSYDVMTSQQVIDRANDIHRDLVARKKAEAKRLGVPYDQAADQSPVSEFDTPAGKQKTLNESSPAARQAMQEYAAAHPSATLEDLKTAVAPYKPLAVRESRAIPYNLDGQRLLVLKDGKEAFDGQQSDKTSYGPQTGIESFVQSWSLMDSALLEPFLLPGQNLQIGDDGSIPVIVPLTAGEQLAGTEALPKTAKPAEKLEHIRKLRESVKSVRFAVCYRNQSSAQLVDKAVEQAREMDRNKDKRGYGKPDLVYGTPTEACGEPAIVRDVRSVSQKAADAKQEEFDRIFGKQPPVQQKYTFRVVGMVSDPPGFTANGLDDMIGSLVRSSLGNGWYTPLDIGLEQATIASLFPVESGFYSSGPSYQVEVASAAQAKSLMEKQGCYPDFSSVQGPGDDPFADCKAEGKFFQMVSYGSNSLGLDEAKQWFGKIFTIAALVVAGIAMIVMMGTVGRMIADSRRETAVFRAIGAKKLDIAQIYTLYTIFLAILISVFAVLLGLLLAGIAHQRWSEGLTMQALIAYNAQDLSRTFDLYSLYAPDMLFLIGLALGGGIISAVFPLIRNLRRNPIRDMRDDT